MIAQFVAAGVRVFTGVQARWTGCGPSPIQRIYFANHSSNLDFLVLWSVLPANSRRNTRPVAAKDYWQGGGLRQFMANHVFRGVLIDRNAAPGPTRVVDELIAVLQTGDSLIIFPEGGRTIGSEMRPFKSGLYHMAKALPEIELIPVYIDNASRVLPKGEFLPIPFLCSVSFGAAMHVEPNETKEDFLQRARSCVEVLSKS